MTDLRTIPASEAEQVEILLNEEANTITFVSDRPDTRETIPPTEWLTVSADAVVDCQAYR